jgi:hypothetical protein
VTKIYWLDKKMCENFSAQLLYSLSEAAIFASQMKAGNSLK